MFQFHQPGRLWSIILGLHRIMHLEFSALHFYVPLLWCNNFLDFHLSRQIWVNFDPVSFLCEYNAEACWGLLVVPWGVIWYLIKTLWSLSSTSPSVIFFSPSLLSRVFQQVHCWMDLMERFEHVPHLLLRNWANSSEKNGGPLSLTRVSGTPCAVIVFSELSLLLLLRP